MMRLRWIPPAAHQSTDLGTAALLVLCKTTPNWPELGRVTRTQIKPAAYDVTTAWGATKRSTNLRRAKAWLRTEAAKQLMQVATREGARAACGVCATKRAIRDADRERMAKREKGRVA